MMRQNGRVAYRVVHRDRCSIYLLDMSKRRAQPLPSIQSWLKSDLLFLKLSLDSGMPVDEVAGFLARDEEEVGEKAEELRHSA
jgi:hypothetical protein